MSHPQQAQEPAGAAEEGTPEPGRWLTLVLLCLAQFILIIDITVVQIALPSIGADLGLGREPLTWVVTTYTLCFGGFMVLGGRLGDAYGARRLLLTGLTVFTAASLACGLSQGAALLIAGRAAQGIGAALVSPAALAIIVTTFRGTERNRALAVWGAIGAAGIAIGVILSGALTAGPGWQWIFFINVPIGILVLVVVPLIVRRDQEQARQHIDLPGALLVTLATALLVYGLIAAGDSGWGAAKTLLPVIAALVLYAVFAAIEGRVTAPLMRLKTLGRRPVIAGTTVIMIATTLTISMFFLSSLYLQQTRAFGSLKTGLTFLPVAITTAAGAYLGAQLIGRFGAKIVATAAFAVAAVGTALMTQVSVTGNAAAELLPGFLIASFGIGPAFVAATGTALASVPSDEAGVASGMVNTFHELGGAVGVAVMSTVAAASISSLNPNSAGYSTAFLVCAILAAVAAVVASVLVPAGKPDAPMHGHGHGHGHGH
jgi:EmrB/QacA subfamily drug resistance transporter